MEWFPVALLNKLPSTDFILEVKAGSKKLCLIKHQARLFLTDRYCPHAGGNLGGGWCKEGKLVCPIHRFEYDLNTGKGSPGQGDYIDVYELKIEGGQVLAGIKKSWWKIW